MAYEYPEAMVDECAFCRNSTNYWGKPTGCYVLGHAKTGPVLRDEPKE